MRRTGPPDPFAVVMVWQAPSPWPAPRPHPKIYLAPVDLLVRSMIRILLVALAVSMAAAVLSVREGVLANGAAREIFRGRQGAYELVVGVRPERPRVGTSHFTVTPLNAKTSVLVLAATIKLVAYDSDSQPGVRTHARNTPLSPRFYDADIDFAYAGEWTLWVSVDNDTLGDATFVVTVSVGERPSSVPLVVTVTGLSVAGALFGAAMYLGYLRRRGMDWRRALDP